MLEHVHVSEISFEWGWSLLMQAVTPTRQLIVTMTNGEHNAHKIPPAKNLMHRKKPSVIGSLQKPGQMEIEKCTKEIEI